MDPSRRADLESARATRKMVIRLTAPIVALSLLLLASGAIAAWYLHRIQKDNPGHLAHDVAGVRAAEELAIAAIQIEIHLDQFLLGGDPTHLDAPHPPRPDREVAGSRTERLGTSGEERAMLAEIRRATERFWRSWPRSSGGRTRGDEAGGPRLSSASDQAGPDPGPGVPRRQGRGRAVHRTEPDDAGPGGPRPAPAGLCGAVAGLLAGYGIARGIGRSIAQLSVPIHDAAGKLSEVVGPIIRRPRTSTT